MIYFTKIYKKAVYFGTLDHSKLRKKHFPCFLIEGKPNPGSFALIVGGTN